MAGSVLAVSCRPAPPIRVPLPAVLPTAAELVGVLEERRAAVHSLRGFAQIAYESGDENLASRHAVLARRPDHLRLEVLSPFGALAVVASDGREFAVYARRESKIYRGPATAGSVAAYTAVPMTVADAVAILLGTPPPRAVRGEPQVSADSAAGLIRLSLPIDGGTQHVGFAPATLQPTESELPLPDGRILRVTFEEYRALGSFAFPHRIAVRALPGDRAVRVEYSTPSINTEIVEALFGFPPRDGVEELVIEQYPVAEAAAAGGPPS